MTIFKSLETSLDLDYPTINPTLDLNFPLTKTLDPRITFTRASTATYVGADGYIKTAVANEPRFDHNQNGKCLGLLIEESRTNLLTNSENFSTWSYQSSTGTTRFSLTQNISDIKSPDGLFTSDLITETTNNGPGYYNKTLPISAGSYYSISFYVYGFGKYSSNTSSRRLIFGLFETSSGTAVEGHTVAFNLGSTSVTSSRLGKPAFAGGTGISTVFTETGASIISIGNGWKRVSVYGKCSVSNPLIILTTLNRELDSGDNDGGGTFSMAGDGFSGISIWGVQGEAGSYPTSYIPTSGSTVTRLADSATITGTKFSSWYNTSEGTLLSVGEPISSNISSNTSLNIIPSSSSTRTVSNLLYYPKVIQYATLKSMNANGYSYPSSIVTAGLILYLDAGNTQSYSGSGTTWTDLSGNGRNGTLTNGPTYSSSNGGSIVFDGTNDYVSLPNTGIRNLLSTDCTITLIFSYATGAGLVFPTLIGSMGFGGNWVGWRLVFTASNRTLTFNNASGINGSNQSSIDFNYIFPDDINKLTLITCTWNSSTGAKSTYVNGVLTNSISSSTYGFGENLESPRIASLSNGQTDNFFKGSVLQTLLYNRALSASELQQNFNALRGRYGI